MVRYSSIIEGLSASLAPEFCTPAESSKVVDLLPLPLPNWRRIEAGDWWCRWKDEIPSFAKSSKLSSDVPIGPFVTKLGLRFAEEVIYASLFTGGILKYSEGE